MDKLVEALEKRYSSNKPSKNKKKNADPPDDLTDAEFEAARQGNCTQDATLHAVPGSDCLRTGGLLLLCCAPVWHCHLPCVC